jgi:hypothetical protein
MTILFQSMICSFLLLLIFLLTFINKQWQYIFSSLAQLVFKTTTFNSVQMPK